MSETERGELTRRLDEAEEALRECTRLSGADLSDGFPTWPPLHEFAVREVGRLRDDYDEEPSPEETRARTVDAVVEWLLANAGDDDLTPVRRAIANRVAREFGAGEEGTEKERQGNE